MVTFDTFCALKIYYFFSDTIPGEDSSKGLPTDPVKLRELREHIGMELLWTEQAIQSRKKVRNHVLKVQFKVKSVYEPSGTAGWSLSWFLQHEITRGISLSPPPPPQARWDTSALQGYPQH